MNTNPDALTIIDRATDAGAPRPRAQKGDRVWIECTVVAAGADSLILDPVQGSDHNGEAVHIEIDRCHTADLPTLRDAARALRAATHRRDALVALLRELIDIEGPQPGNVAWFNRVKEALAKVRS